VPIRPALLPAIQQSHGTKALMTSVIGILTTGACRNRRSEASDLHGVSDLQVLLDLQAPRRIWQSSEARLPRKVFNRTYDHSAQETEI
jgi:hypothetical protein